MIHISNEHYKRILSRFKQLILFRYIIILLCIRKFIETSKNTVLAVFFLCTLVRTPHPPQKPTPSLTQPHLKFFLFYFFICQYIVSSQDINHVFLIFRIIFYVFLKFFPKYFCFYEKTSYICSVELIKRIKKWI